MVLSPRFLYDASTGSSGLADPRKVAGHVTLALSAIASIVVWSGV